MFIPVLLILATVWSATDGALSCPTVKGDECIFPFVTSAGKEVSECQAYKSKFYCATSVKADKKYKTWDYCIKEKCVEEKDIDKPACIACVVMHASVCLPLCFPNPVNKACATCVLTHAIECAGVCGLEAHIVASTYGLAGVHDTPMEGDPAPAGPSCILISKYYEGQLIANSTQTNVPTASACGTYCNKNFPSSCVAWNWFTNNVMNGQNTKKCMCLDSRGSFPQTKAFVNTGLGPAKSQTQCPPLNKLDALNTLTELIALNAVGGRNA